MKTLRGVLFALPLTALMAGCPIYGGDEDERDCSRPFACQCTIDADCPAGYVCGVEYYCTLDLRPDAGRDAQVGPDAGRDAQVVVPDAGMPDTNRYDAGPIDCRTHGDCPTGFYCGNDDVCVPSDTCTADGECDANEWCDFRGTCVPRSGCRTEADCTAGQSCVEGQCRDHSQTCSRDPDCAGGTLCVNTECTPTCVNDTTCAAGDRCEDGFCRPDTTECTSTAECGNNEHCVDGRCLPDCESNPNVCAAGSSCAPDGFCRPDWEPSSYCTKNYDGLPLEEGECREFRECINGGCRTPCTSNSQCMTLDGTLPFCLMVEPFPSRQLCYETDTGPRPPACREAAECGDPSMNDCRNGQCRAR